MQRPSRLTGAVPAICLVALGCGTALAETEEPPRKLDRVEQVTRQLVQIDVTVEGPREVAGRLEPGDLVLTVNGKTITDFVLDSACPSVSPAPGEAVPSVPPPRPVTYLFYFEQTQMSAEGRVRAISLGRELLPRLVAGGSRAAIMSNGRGLITYSGPTPDLSALGAALDRMEREGPGVDPSAIDEEARVEEIQRIVREQTADVAWQFHNLRSYGGVMAASADEIRGDTSGAKAAVLAKVRDYQVEEQAHARTSFERFTLALRQISDAPGPKAVLFFADNLRINAGAHYYRVLELSPEGKSLAKTSPSAQGFPPMDGFEDPANKRTLQGSGSFSSVEAFLDALVVAASEQGVRFYPIEAQGFSTSAVRVSDAQRALRTLAKETGGRAFLGGVSSARIADAVREDLSCLYVLSFDPGGLPRDRPLPLFVATNRDGLTLRARGRIGIASKETRLRSDKLAALYGASTLRPALPMRSALIPIGFEKKKFSVLAQVAVLDTPGAGSRWDLSAWLVTDGALGEEISGSVKASRAGGAVVLERILEIEPGVHTLVSVGQEPETELTLRDVQSGSWPDPASGAAIVAPTVMLQPAAARIDRDGVLREEGSLVVGSGSAVQTALPLALVGLVCRGAQETRALRVERRLEGEAVVEFPAIGLEREESACAQVRDLIPARTLSEGLFRYEIAVKAEGAILARSVLEFAAGPTPTP